jgi:hypothetical protein
LLRQFVPRNDIGVVLPSVGRHRWNPVEVRLLDPGINVEEQVWKYHRGRDRFKPVRRMFRWTKIGGKTGIVEI